MNEIWKTYTKNAGRGKHKHCIEVSNLGNVKVDGKQIDFSKRHPTRYYQVFLLYVHRMVAETFIPNPENKPQVDHIDTNRFNNRIDNLRWVTQSENNLNPITRKHISKSMKNNEKLKRSNKKFAEEHPEWKKEISERMKKRYEDPDERKKLSEKMKNRKWLTDGTVRLSIEPEYWGEFLDIGFWFVNEKHHKLLYYKKTKNKNEII